jgi:hypothetical protein
MLAPGLPIDEVVMAEIMGFAAHVGESDGD